MSKKRIIVCFTIITATLTLVFCEKKLFGSVEVHGTILHYYTKRPVSVPVSLMADDIHSASDYYAESVTLAQTTSKSDGFFSLKSKPSKGSNYYLHIDNLRYYDTTKTSKIDVIQNGKKDMGILYAGTQEFIIKIFLHSFGKKCLWINGENARTGRNILFKNGTDTTIVRKAKYGQADYEGSGHAYFLSCMVDYYDQYYDPAYYTTPIHINTTYSVPLAPTDTTYMTIEY